MQSSPQIQDENTLGLVLLNMGGPIDLDAVQPFLYNLFKDPEIIVLPWLLRPFQKPLAWIISKVRTPSTSEMYEHIGNGSPILEITEQLGKEMTPYFEDTYNEVFTTSLMRYTPPRSDEVVEALRANDVDTVVLFSQYPHYADSTTGSSFNDFYQALERTDYEPNIIEITEWGTEPEYINWWTEGILKVFEEHQIDRDQSTHLIFSAHGLPMRYVNAGETYPDRIKEAAQLILDELGAITDDITTHVSFQSQAGPVEWTKPYTDDLIQEIAEEENQTLVIVPLGFVSNHVETLYEIDILYKEEALEAGIEGYYRVEVPDADPEYAKSVSEMVTRKIAEKES